MSSTSPPLIELFRQKGAYLEGHFRLTSGLHSPAYLQCALVLQYPELAASLGQQLANELARLVPLDHLDAVVSPALGGLIIGHEVARALHSRHLFTERVDGKMALRRGFQLKPGERAAVVEDVITTGGSTLEVIELLSSQGIEVVCAGSIIDRSGGRAKINTPHVALASLNIATYSEQDCPLCKQGLPLLKPGSRPLAPAS
ncbi:MAG: orotate phosphoribosyltransferase [Bryobacteraceae bacterium]|nr:orotate phosphoribosyltransferase [Bryobacteraceae bacterium]MDW8378415.1 orotate phosphoribosyltransferase [Bryobacterales bacterium]